MTTLSFNDGWTVGPKTSIYAALQGDAGSGTPVTLPHDAQIGLERSAALGEGPHNGFHPSVAVTYSKTFDVPERYRDRRVTVEFQGAYRDAVVFLNGTFLAQRPNGYATFRVPLDDVLRHGAPNTLTVELRAHRDSRWYTGAGLHRDVRLHVTPLVHVGADGVRVTTPDVDAERAVVEVATSVVNDERHTRTVTVRTVVVGPDGTAVASDDAPVTVRPGRRATVRQRMYVRAPRLWDTESPELYTATTTLLHDGEPGDGCSTPFGIRTLRLDPHHGLRLNGRTVKLRGACIHHDNGLLGAAAVGAAEERRVRILKEAGFNALRSAHNPVSQAMLDACDRLGMLVVDELTDVWTVSKSDHDYSLAFPEWWERDVEAMVAKDVNHPSVVMYSIGNENPEAGDGLGAGWSRALAEKVRELDPTRYVTNGVNGFVAAVKEVAALVQEHAAAAADAAGGVNDAMNMGDFMNQVSASPMVTERTAEALATLDVAGLNYADARYALDKDLFPNRVIVGTETFPSHIAVSWGLVEEQAHVLGDFTWTGWDYLGEAGAGRITYLDGDGGAPSFEAGFPWLTSWTGDIDITGHRRPVSYYRETVFGLRSEPYIAVQRPETVGRPCFAGQWAWSDTVSGWSWDVPEGTRTSVEVYSDADEVELLLDGHPVGRAPAGRAHAFRAVFDVEIRPGVLEAVAYVDGQETGRTALRSATGPVRLTAEPEQDVIAADDAALAYVPIELRDASGTLVHAIDRVVEVAVEGPGVLAGLGSGRPDQTERFDDGRHTTFDGRVLAVVRPTGPGTITLTVSADGLEPVVTEVHVTDPAARGTADLREQVVTAGA